MSEVENMYAHTKYNNNEETDKIPQVIHVVKYKVNNKQYSMELMAECPINAMEKVKAILLMDKVVR